MFAAHLERLSGILQPTADAPTPSPDNVAALARRVVEAREALERTLVEVRESHASAMARLAQEHRDAMAALQATADAREHTATELSADIARLQASLAAVQHQHDAATATLAALRAANDDQARCVGMGRRRGWVVVGVGMGAGPVSFGLAADPSCPRGR